MQISKREASFLEHTLEDWQDSGVINEQEKSKLKDSYQVMPFNWKTIRFLSILVALGFAVCALFSVLMDIQLLRLLENIFNISASVRCVFFSLLSGLLYYWGKKRLAKQPHKFIWNQVILILGIITTAIAVISLGIALDSPEARNPSFLFLLIAVIYAAVGLWVPAKLIWSCGLFIFPIWAGIEMLRLDPFSEYSSKIAVYSAFLLTNILLLGLVSVAFKKWTNKKDFLNISKCIIFSHISFLLCFIYLDGVPREIRWLFPNKWLWDIFLIALCAASIYYSVKFNDKIVRVWGMSLLLIIFYMNLFFSIGEDLHISIHLLIVGSNIWFLGTKAEKIWNLTLFSKNKELSKNKALKN